MRTEIGPIRLLTSSPRHCQGAPKYPKLFIVFTSWPIYEELIIFVVVHMSPLWWGLNSLTLWYLGFSKWSSRTSQTWTKIIIWIVYTYIDIGERRAEKQDGSTMIIEGPPGPTNINIYIFFTMWSIYMKYQLFICHCRTCIYPVMKCFCITQNYGVKFIFKYSWCLPLIPFILIKCRPHLGGDICTTRKNNWQPICHRLSQCFCY